MNGLGIRAFQRYPSVSSVSNAALQKESEAPIRARSPTSVFAPVSPATHLQACETNREMVCVWNRKMARLQIRASSS